MFTTLQQLCALQQYSSVAGQIPLPACIHSSAAPVFAFTCKLLLASAAAQRARLLIPLLLPGHFLMQLFS